MKKISLISLLVFLLIFKSIYAIDSQASASAASIAIQNLSEEELNHKIILENLESISLEEINNNEEIKRYIIENNISLEEINKNNEVKTDLNEKVQTPQNTLSKTELGVKENLSNNSDFINLEKKLNYLYLIIGFIFILNLSLFYLIFRIKKN